jgi:Raf kinase inhibitor-like YbhB/YbcL family protein
MTRWWLFLLCMVGLLSACAGVQRSAVTLPQPVDQPTQVSEGGVTMKLTSSAFTEGAMIPSRYTCDGQDISPPLAWADVPMGTKAMALICDDPDAAAGTWVHWVLFNLPADSTGLPEGVPAADRTLKTGGAQGTNSFRRIGYGGPCPSGGTHRYFFKLYALDGPLALGNNATAKDVTTAMKGHVLAETQLMGRYKRK